MPAETSTESLRAHWEAIHADRSAAARRSWHAAHLATSLAFVTRFAPGPETAILDAGGGDSTFVADLLARGYRRLTAVDISEAALDAARAPLGASASSVHWIPGDIITMALPRAAYDIWHDRALYHFQTTQERRRLYRQQVEHALRPGGFLILATFGPSGPEKCSGLSACRYNPEALGDQLGRRFRLIEATLEIHPKPLGGTQQFLYTCWQRDAKA